ncbi:hypothetical protein I5M27_07495 [Adhaeribacter sp. BT258]|uniref:Uncharacterized protein n=1 Tax=Adhaeribacter terrigena TaxID=2793070 RepID=A0ABS1C0A1_9BACT|nr:hypothetical protein [Adhaeribacter terrigena]MBK0402826.1 hypothetical protein [Adhaeribacter terrigena]
MKTKLLLLMLFFILFQVRAQDNSLEVPTIKNHGKVDVPAENQYLMRRLLLNQTQFEQIENINTERNQMLEMVAGMYRFDPENYNKKRLELELQFDAEFEKVLTKQQFSEYLAINGRTPEKETPEDQLNNEGENSQLAVQPEETSEPAKPTFNDQIHAILEKATSIKIDSALIAKQDTSDFEPLTPEEESLLNGLRPLNATLIAIQADTAKKPAAVANANTDTELKTDGECKTCYAVDPEDSTAQKSKLIALKSSKKAAQKTDLQQEWKAAEENSNNETNSVAETDSLFSEPKDETSAPEDPAPEKSQSIAVEQDPAESDEEAPLTNTERNENSLVIPADEVKKLRENLPPANNNGMDSEEETATQEPEIPSLAERLPLNKSLAEELEP